jgi:SAM-dependent methyltransferase
MQEIPPSSYPDQTSYGGIKHYNYFYDMMVRSRACDGHPYAHNRVWQQRYRVLRQWIARLGLERGLALEVGCGMGTLQNEVARYIGVDLVPTSAFHIRKPFAACSGTHLPFLDNTFDAVWSIWVLEHVYDPQAMLAEMRRVTRPGGSVFICAVDGVGSWASQGLRVRPFRDLSWTQRIKKVLLPLRTFSISRMLFVIPGRLRELADYLRSRQPTRLRYSRLQPNYDIYWESDADACVSLSAYSMMLYFLSRGDQAVFPYTQLLRGLLLRDEPQAYIVRKAQSDHHSRANPPTSGATLSDSIDGTSSNL